MKSFSNVRKTDHSSSRLRGISIMLSLSEDWFFERGGTLSVEVLGVERLSIELVGKLLVDEFVD